MQEFDIGVRRNDWQSAFLDELLNDPGQEEDEDSDCETEDDNAGQDVVPKTNHTRKQLWPLKMLYYFYKHKGNTEEASYDAICMYNNTIETLQPFKPHWRVFLVNTELLTIL